MKYTWDYTWDFEDDVPLDPALYVSPIELMLLNGDSRDCRIGVDTRSIGEEPSRDCVQKDGIGQIYFNQRVDQANKLDLKPSSSQDSICNEVQRQRTRKRKLPAFGGSEGKDKDNTACFFEAENGSNAMYVKRRKLGESAVNLASRSSYVQEGPCQSDQDNGGADDLFDFLDPAKLDSDTFGRCAKEPNVPINHPELDEARKDRTRSYPLPQVKGATKAKHDHHSTRATEPHQCFQKPNDIDIHPTLGWDTQVRGIQTRQQRIWKTRNQRHSIKGNGHILSGQSFGFDKQQDQQSTHQPQNPTREAKGVGSAPGRGRRDLNIYMNKKNSSAEIQQKHLAASADSWRTHLISSQVKLPACESTKADGEHNVPKASFAATPHITPSSKDHQHEEVDFRKEVPRTGEEAQTIQRALFATQLNARFLTGRKWIRTSLYESYETQLAEILEAFKEEWPHSRNTYSLQRMPGLMYSRQPWTGGFGKWVQATGLDSQLMAENWEMAAPNAAQEVVIRKRNLKCGAQLLFDYR